tara:strand:- start:927 stop:1127 length:201 start_codon:yes stop_codon:yes gene_type:complete
MDPQNAQPEICEETSTISSEARFENKKNPDGSKKTVNEIFKERLSKQKKIQMKDMALNDKLDYRDP